MEKTKRQSKSKKNQKKKNEMAKKAKNTERQKKRNKWIEDEQKEWIKRQNRHSKREDVELEKEKSPFLSLKKETAKKETIHKNVFFWNDRKYVKGENKEGTEKEFYQIKENLQKRDTFQQKRETKEKQIFKRTKNENVQKTNKKHKKENFLFLSKAWRKGQTCKKTNYKFVKIVQQ